mgnify:CR=1 FL=1
MKLTKEQIDEIVAAVVDDSGDGSDAARRQQVRARLTRAFGERVNPYELSRGCGGPVGLVPALFNAAAKVADGCDASGGLLATTFNHEADRAALKRIVEEIRGMA